ncbi:hypothetical protein DPMN_032333 [Dreissena polymorpha]|uniref:Uncharacterized protein n=1 Tax=Dreissena polymorpha TaxID=45954 RepID=A0A9D4M4T1_DREPO|nr:hypothetical protein DPMN_032333 [Dreissena polymorpha]
MAGNPHPLGPYGPWTIRPRPYGPDSRTIRPRLSDYTAQICGPYGPDLQSIRTMS